MQIKTQKNGKTMTISLIGDFDFRARTLFRNVFKDLPKDTVYRLDFAGVESIDSSGCGLLLLLREHAGVTAADITLIHCNSVVRMALDVAKFDQLFKIQ